MKDKILQALREELQRAEKKELVAEEVYRLKKRVNNKYHWDEAGGYVNGILEAIDIVQRIKEEE